MGREKTGKRYMGFDDLERRWPRLPDDLIEPSKVSDQLPQKMLPIGLYNTTLYGRCMYGNQYGIYGTDKYGECVYE